MKKIRTYIAACFTITLLLCNLALFAQNASDDVKVVRGRIIDKKDKSPVSHVSVTEMDADGRTVRSVTTDIDGNYAIKITSAKHKIVFSYIGYKTIEEYIKGRSNINISFEPSIGSNMDDVVVVSRKQVDNGTGLNIDERNSTIASTKINASDLEEMQATSIDQALEGRVAGMDIVANSGDPGAGMSIRIRGTSSINSSDNPLIVVDGMPYETSIPSDFNFGTADDQGYAQLLNIAPSDIKEITVLKDAAATAVWGSRAANGVLIITTKRGKVGRPVVTYTVRGTRSEEPRPIPLLNGNQYSQLIPEMVMNKNGTPLNPLTTPEFAYDPSNPYYYYNYSQNTDWLGAISRSGYTQDHNLSLSGGGDKARYFTSLGYLQQSGTTVGADLSRITARINLDYIVSEKIRFRTDIAYTYSDNPRNYSAVRNVAINKMPNMSIYEFNEFGIKTPNYFSPASNIQGQYPGTYNPVAMANTAINGVISNRVTPHFNVQYKIREGLTATADVQFDINNNKNTSFLPQVATGRPITETVVNRAYYGDVDIFNVQSKVNLVYTPKLKNNNHSFTSLVSLNTSDTKALTFQDQSSNSASSNLQSTATPARTQNSELGLSAPFGQTRSVGLLFSGQYGYKQRYIVNVGLRGDGNSRFGPANRYGLFPSISTRWRVSDEKPLRRLKFIDDLSLRASYGQSGNAPRSDYSFYNMYNNFQFTYLGQAGVYPSNMELKNLKWEVVNGSNLGVNLIVMKRKINIDFELYKNRTKDLLFNGLQIASFTGYDNVNLNVGTIDNQGWELNLMTKLYQSKQITLDFNFNIAHNENIIRSVSPRYPQSKGVTTANGVYLTLLQINNPFGSFYGYRFNGVYKDKAATVATDAKGQPIIGPNGQAVYMRFNYPTTDYLFQPGDSKYEDVNHDGNIDYKDLVYLGNSNPKYSGGFGFTLTYKRNLKISTFFNYRSSLDVVNGTKMNTTNMYGFNNQSTAVLRRWRNPGDVTQIPRALWNSGYNWLGSDRYVEDASFLRLRSVTVRYNVVGDLLKKLKIKSFSAYLTAENLLTFTKYTGQDPEVTTRLSAFSVTTDVSNTPPSRTITFGLVGSF